MMHSLFKHKSGVRRFFGSRAARAAGFTLFEFAIVLVVTSLVAGGVLTMATRKMDTSQEDVTFDRLDAIEDALLAFRKANDRLPCPADATQSVNSASFGAETATPGTCTGSVTLTGGSGNGRGGVVPVKALHLPDEYMFDGWGQKFDYAVDKQMTATSAFTNHPATDATVGDLIVNDQTGAARTSKAVYVVLSHGKNGHGGYRRTNAVMNAGSTNTDEQNNCNCTSAAGAGTVNNVFVQRSRLVDSSGGLNNFDDIVRYKVRPYIKEAPISPAVAATATNVTGPGNGTYPAGSIMHIEITYDQAVTVTGTPQVAINIGGSTVYASYVSGSGSTTLVFEYIVATGLTDGDGVALVSPVNLNGGAIAVGGVNADLTFTPPVTTAVLVNTAAPAAWVDVPAATLPDGTNVGAFKVMAYEAKFVGGVATSQAANQPWLNITWNNAAAACTALGGGARMIKETEWLSIAHNAAAQPSNWTSGVVGTGYLFRGHTDSNPFGAPDAGAGTDGYVNTGNNASEAAGSGREQRRTMALSNGSVLWDIVGNGQEYTYCDSGTGCLAGGNAGLANSPQYVDPVSSSASVGVGYEFTNATVTQANLKPQNSYTSAQYAGIALVSTSDGTDVLIRSSTWVHGAGAGIFRLDALSDPAGATAYLGFRCSKPATVPPTVTVFTPPGNATYPQSSVMNFQVTFSAAVTVTGTPLIKFSMDSGVANASYVSGSGTTTLTFEYIVAAGASDVDGIEIDSIQLSGGTIKDGSGTDADLTLAPPATPNVKVNTAAPAAWVDVPAVTLPDGTNVAAFKVMAYEAKDVGGIATSQAGSAPWSSISWTAANAACVALGGGAKLMTETEWMAIAHNAVTQASNWATGIVGNSYLVHGHSDNTPSNSLDAGAGTDGYANTGNSAAQAVLFGREERRTFALSNGSILWDVAGNLSEWSYCDSGVTGCASGGGATPGRISGNTLDYFSATVGGGSLGEGMSYDLNSAHLGTNFKPAGGYTTANSTGQVTTGITHATPFAAIRSSGWNLVGGLFSVKGSIQTTSSTSLGFRCSKPMVAPAPTITSFTPPGNATYPKSSVMNFQATFSEAVNVTGTPRIQLTVGAATVYANYVSGTGTTTLTFEYYPGAGASDSDGITVISPIGLNGGTIKNAGATDATLTFTVPDTSSVKVTTAAPGAWVTVPAVTLPDGTNVGSFYVMGYEARNIGGVATSQAANAPWAFAQFTTAESQCSALGSGAHMITESEWLAIAHNVASQASNWTSGIVGTGMLISGNSDSAPGSALDSGDGTDGYSGTGDMVSEAAGSGREQRRTFALSNGGIVWDLAGNLTEFTYCDDMFVGCEPPGPEAGRGVSMKYIDLDNSNPPTDVAIDLDHATVTNLNLKPAGGYTHATNHTGYLYIYTGGGAPSPYDTIMRGGSWNAWGGGGIFQYDSNNDLGVNWNQTGFRCAKPLFAPTTISSVTPPGDATYPQGSIMNVRVTFSAAVTVTGTPRVPIDIGVTTVYANYVSGSGTTTLTFEYAVAAGLTDSDGVTLKSPVELNGGTIKDGANNNATLTYVPGATPNVKVDTAAPSAWVTVPATTLPDGTNVATFDVMAYEAKDVGGTATSQAASAPWVNITHANAATACTALGGGKQLIREKQWLAIVHNAAAQPSNWSSGIVGTGHLMRGHTDDSPSNTIAAGSADGYSNTGNSTSDAAGSGREQRRTIALSNGSVIWDMAGNVREFSYCTNDGTPGCGASGWANGRQYLDPTNNSLSDGNHEYTEAAVTNTNVKPQGGYNTTKSTGDGVSDSNSGRPIVRGGSYATGTTAGLFKMNTGNLSTISQPTIGFRCTTGGSTGPTITTVTAPANTTYMQAEAMSFTFTFSAAVNVTGTPRVALDIGGTTVYATYASGTGTTNLVFTYTVAANLSDLNGIAMTSPIDLNGGTIKDASTNDATLTFTAPNTTGVLVYSNPWVTVPGAGGYQVAAYVIRLNGGSPTLNPADPVTLTTYTTANTRCSTYDAAATRITDARWVTLAKNLITVGANWTGGAVGSGSLKTSGKFILTNGQAVKDLMEYDQHLGIMDSIDLSDQTANPGAVLNSCGGSMYYTLPSFCSGTGMSPSSDVQQVVELNSALVTNPSVKLPAGYTGYTSAQGVGLATLNWYGMRILGGNVLYSACGLTTRGLSSGGIFGFTTRGACHLATYNNTTAAARCAKP